MLKSASRQIGLLRSRPAKRILSVCVVDPQVGDYEGWESLATENGLRLQIVGSAEAALCIARIQAVDLWVVNTKLAGLSGFELCDILKRQSPHTAVYLVADEYTPEAERAAWQARATLFGCKGGHIDWFNEWLAECAR